MADEVQYKPNGDNRVLRQFLREIWGSRCYWCNEPQPFSALEIDHILPQDSTTEQRAQWTAAFDLPADYDIHALYNLAPICGPCNKKKSSKDLSKLGVVHNHLSSAQKYAPLVTKRVLAFNQQPQLGAALLLAAEVDLTDADTLATFEEGAPAIVQRLAELQPEKADYLTYRAVALEVDDEPHSFYVSLNEQGRAAVNVLEQIAGGVLDEVLKDPIEDLFVRAEEATADALRLHDEGLGAPDVGKPSIWPSIAITIVRYSAIGPGEIEFAFEGTFEGWATAFVARDNPWGDGLEEIEQEATFSCSFIFELTWDLNPDGSTDFHFDQVWLENLEVDTVMNGSQWDMPAEASEVGPLSDTESS
ncbi:HNH endonuclease [Nocardioides sp. NPDC057764]|uniref:HNH endonuclease n=1 Tax=Nocardioides sp. NPDC057764 TaxID=3346243 RepID=UPI00366F65F7